MSTECSVCPIKKLFAGDEYDIYRNMLDLTYLGVFHANLFACLKDIFHTKKHIVCNLIFVKYSYSHINWYNGKKYLISLSEALDCYQQKQIDKIRNNDCKVVIKSIYLSSFLVW